MRLRYNLGLGILAVGISLFTLFTGCKQPSPTVPQPLPYQVVLNKQCDFESARKSSAINQYISCLNEAVPRDIVDSVTYNPEFGEIAGVRPLNDYDMMGRRVKRDVVLGKKFFKDIETNAEAEGVIIHEIRHQVDYFHGIRFGDISLPFSVPSSELTVEFMKTLEENRGYYEEVKFLRNASRRGQKITNRHMCTAATRYVLYSYRLNKLPQNETQRRIAESQISLMTDVEWEANFLDTGVDPKINQVELLFEKQDRYWCESPQPVD